ncbi:unnamed protein product [Lymnaea stagnalis]|uniref:Gamma-tubulin complex component 6 n=1 Tax=Lymnaea stagnalis TaxID=6523 RepID=A0AAV2H4C8_LYMST
MSETSVLTLFDCLCSYHLGPTQRAYRSQPTLSRTEAQKKLKRRVFDTLFTFLKDKSLKVDKENGPYCNVMKQILIEIFKLRTERKYEDADRLEELFNRLYKGDNNTDIQLYLRFIVALKNSGDIPPKHPTEDVFHFPLVERNKKQATIVPSAPLCYGDLKFSRIFSLHYMQYPSEIFSRTFAEPIRDDEKALSYKFELPPGKGIGPDCLFSMKFHIGDTHESTTHDSMFGGLIEGRLKSLDTMLQLPDLPAVPQFRIPEFHCKNSSSSSTESSETSGLGSGSASMTSSVITLVDQASSDDSIWETALTAPRSNHYTWEWIGYQPGPTERPHLTEAGPGVFDILIQLRQRVSTIVAPDIAPVQMVAVETDFLVKHIVLMLFGVPSELFPFNNDTVSFEIIDGLHVPGTSPEMLHNFLSEFRDCGTFYARLTQFSQAPVLDSFYTGGLVFQAFAGAIRKVLSYFSAELLSIPHNLLLLQLKVHLYKAMQQIRYLAQLCFCHDKPPSPVPYSNFPTGMKLLSYLFEEAQTASSSPHYSMLLSIVQTTWAPFMMFIRDWVFHGVLRDMYDEFMIQVDLSCLESRDERYWNKAYTLKLNEGNSQGIPQFLTDIISDIVTCGKAINLLRICNPQHFLCKVSESDIPPVTITYSKVYLKDSERYCNIYVGRMRQIARQVTEDRQEVLKRIEREKLELQKTARVTADKEIARLQGIIDERKRKADAKKRIEFDRLKKQMMDDLERRSNKVQEQKEEDRKYMARINKEEDAMTQQEIETEMKARDELVAYYTELGEEAMRRERLALWRIRRAQLGHARYLFLEADAERWKKEWESPRDQDITDGRLSPSLPRWAERASDRNAPIEILDSEEFTLPKWAVRDSPALIVTEEVNTLEIDIEALLPAWAKKNANQPGSETLVVGDEDVSEGEGENDDGFKIEKQSELSVTSDKEHLQTEGTQENAVESDVSKGPHDNVIEDSNGTHDNFILDSNGLHDKMVQHNTEINKDSSKTAVIGNNEENSKNSKISSGVPGLTEGEETVPKACTHAVEGQHVTKESEGSPKTKPHIKMMKGVGSLKETEESTAKKHIKTSGVMSASKESDPKSTEHKSHIKFRQGRQVNDESSDQRQMIPKRQRAQNAQSGTETESKVWVIKKPSMFGHVSQLSNTSYVLTVPKLRRQSERHASMESSYKDFSIKPQVRMNKNMSASKESEDSPKSFKHRPHIRVLAHRNASIESQQVDENDLKRKRFLSRNAKGHSSDSTVQRLLYGDSHKLNSVTEDETDGGLDKITLRPSPPYQAEMYQVEFPDFDQEPSLDLMHNIHVVDLGKDLVDAVVVSEEEVDAYKYTPLSVLLTRSMAAPIRVQIFVTGIQRIAYYTFDLISREVFPTLRLYFCSPAPGSKYSVYTKIILSSVQLATNPLPQEILNPVFLNGALNKAIRSSIHSDDALTKNLSFALKSMPSVLMPNAPNSLKCLQLKYNVSWPLSVILTDSCMEKYYNIFNFLLQIKRVVWVLKDIWHRLKRDALIHMAGNSSQFRQLQLHRQEMEHFVKIMQGYITNQVIHVSWQEFKTDLTQQIAGLDQLCELHERYVDRAISRCLLEKKAEKVMKIIQDIFCLILKFRSQLVSAPWQRNEKQGEVTHAEFDQMLNTYQSFHVYSFFLFKVVSRLSQKGYQPHLQELLLQLNFNGYYTSAGS